jgi:WD repeat-containing protein 61
VKSIHLNKVHTFKGHDAAIYSIAKGLDEHSILSGGADKVVTAWDLDLKLNTNFSIRLPSGIYAIHWHQAKQHLLIGTINGSLHIIDLNVKQEIKCLKLHQGGLWSILYCEKYQRIITSGQDGLIQIIEAEDYATSQSIRLSQHKLRKLEKDDIRDELYVTDSDGHLHILSLYNFKTKFSFKAHQFGCNCVALHPNRRFILTGGRDAFINIWDMDMQYKMIKAIPAHNFAIYDILFSPNGAFFATASRDKSVKIWDTEYLDFLVRIDAKNYDGHVNSVNCIVWQNDNVLISSGDDRSIMVWDIQFT